MKEKREDTAGRLPKAEMQSTARDSSLNQAGPGKRMLDSTVFTEADAGMLEIPFTKL